MLTQDTTAFVEQIDVPKPDRKADKLRRRSANEELEIVHTTVELRLAEEALKRLAEQELAEETSGGDPHGHGLFRRNGRAHARTEDARRMVGHVRERLAAQRARAKELEQQIQDFEAVRPHHTSYRLHSSQHHETYSANQFERMAKAQRTRPVLVTSRGRLSWWWYLDRFWWDDERRDASAIRDAVIGRDGESVRHGAETDHTRAIAVGELPPVLAGPDGPVPEAVRTAVWRRDDGRCVDCGDDDELVFDVIVPVARGGSLNTPNVELRCHSCLAAAERAAADAADPIDSGRTNRWRSPA